MKSNPRLEEAITALSNLYEFGALQAHADPVHFLRRVSADIIALRSQRAVAVKQLVCAGCGATALDAFLAVAKGAVACCPDCSTLTVEERNRIREEITVAGRA